MTKKQSLLIKIGGTSAESPEVFKALLQEIQDLQAHYAVVLVHGGGKEVSQFSRGLGLEPEFREGIRMTRPQEMDHVDMILGGLVNIRLVRRAQTLGLKALGLGGQDGGSFLGQALVREDFPDNRTGKINNSDATLCRLLLDQGFLPIYHSTSMDEGGQGLNINADEAALGLGKALEVDHLVFLSDIPGVLAEGQPLATLDREKAGRLEREGVISGGMVPKVRSCLQALEEGIGSVVIGSFEAKGNLKDLLEKRRGTTFNH